MIIIHKTVQKQKNNADNLQRIESSGLLLYVTKICIDIF